MDTSGHDVASGGGAGGHPSRGICVLQMPLYPPPVSTSLRLKPQDLVLALKLATLGGAPWTQPGLAASLHLSASEVNHGLKRLAACRLYNPHERRVIRASLVELLVHGLRHVFPAVPGAVGSGIPTAHSAKPLSDHIRGDVTDDGGFVWKARGPHPLVRGRIVEPLYATAPAAASEDPALHELLALADALRVGRARERALAAETLSARLEA